MDGATDAVALTEKTEESQEISSAAVKEKTSSENSEYDSVDSYSDEEEQPLIKARSRASGLDSHSGSEGSVILEREEGDGQESVPLKKVDDDEDKKNPQYIPKRGTFYEHDDRTADDVENQEPVDPEKADKDGKKKVWQDKKERWTHDRFDDQEQTPKSRSELVAIYGYDIRNEDGPPRARRRRRYGRGPNKYTRNWEDEDAYSKPAPTHPPKGITKPPRQKKNDSTEEFPPLGSGGRNNRPRTKSRSSDSNHEDNQTNYKESEEAEVPNRKSYERHDHKRQAEPQHQPQSKPSSFSNKQFTENNQDNQSDQNQNRSSQSAKMGTARIVRPKKEIKESDLWGFTSNQRSRQQRGLKKIDNQKVLPPRNKNDEFIQSQNFTNKNNNSNQIAEMEKEISQLNIQDGVYRGGNKHTGGNNSSSRQGSVPPRLQNTEQKGSKRYSSMRQRSLPETNTPPAVNFSFYPNEKDSFETGNKAQGIIPVGARRAQPRPPMSTGWSYYDADYNSAAPPPATQQPLLPNPIPPPTALVAPQVPVTATQPPLLPTAFPPTAAFAPQPPPQAYLQPPPPAFIATPAAQPQIVSYVTQPPQAFVQGYQGQFNTVTQPTDLYQPQGGITYYSTDQQIIQRAVPQKRPKAAIPIVAPTDFKENREFDRSMNQKEEGTFSSNDSQDVHE